MADSISTPWRITRNVLFRVDAERVHRLAIAGLSAWSSVCSVDLPTSDPSRAPSLSRDVMGLKFPNPLGLAAGFDKDAECTPAWQALGFGFVEVGTVTARAQPGNERPRLFRLPDDRALLNRLGFNNHGAAACAARLARVRAAGRVRVPIGVNIGKTKAVALEEAAADYQVSFAAIADVADYVVVNVSSPNTPGLRDLQRVDELARILDAVAGDNARRSTPRPLLVKLAPDLALDDAHALAALAKQRACAGLVVTNTTISRDGLVSPPPRGSGPAGAPMHDAASRATAYGAGGVSGAPVFERSTAMLRALAGRNDGLVLIGVGGVMDAATMQAKLDAGAHLVQAYTGFIYGGPGWVRRTLQGVATPALPSPSSPPTARLHDSRAVTSDGAGRAALPPSGVTP